MERPVVLVTGAARGIGQAIAARFCAEGWAVVATGRQPPQASDAALSLALDVRDGASVRGAISETVRTLGRLDAVVNNAGLAGADSLDPDADESLWSDILEVNLTGTWRVCRQAIPHLADGRGRIVNIGSVLSLRGVPDQPAYCAAKHGVLGLTRALAHHCAPRGITVNAVCPGWVRTDMAEGRWTELGIDEAEAASGMPIGRIIEPAEVAAQVWWLAQPEAGGITGQAIVVDGGTLA
jgi:NAD(P)-dependent dehydrogenase (short-subunit alcohol dehydrogenase family)